MGEERDFYSEVGDRLAVLTQALYVGRNVDKDDNLPEYTTDDFVKVIASCLDILESVKEANAPGAKDIVCAWLSCLLALWIEPAVSSQMIKANLAFVMRRIAKDSPIIKPN